MIGTSRRGTSYRMAQLVLLASALIVSTAWAASLKDKPAKGVTLNATEWRIDPYRSDDPDEVIGKAQAQKDREDQDRVSRRAGGMDRGDGSGPLGGGEDNHGTWGGHSGMPGRPTDLPDGGSSRGPSLPSDRGGGYGQRTDRSSTDIDPTGSSQSATIQFGRTGGIRNEFVGQLAKNPDTLSFREVNDHLAVSEDKLETECAAGKKVPISDSYGDGERNCGWDGRAWVIDTTRGKHFSRTDRYELSKDGKTLTYVTTASGAGMPKVKIYRVYTLAPPKASG
jgi:hypothetical protein